MSTSKPHAHAPATLVSAVPLLLRRAIARVRQAAARRRHARAATLRFTVRTRDTGAPAPVRVVARRPRG